MYFKLKKYIYFLLKDNFKYYIYKFIKFLKNILSKIKSKK